MVEWRRVPISPYRNYEVSDEGGIRRAGRELQGYTDRYGYRTVLLSYAGLSRRYKVHRLVAEAFVGPCPDGMECAHLNGDPGDNRIENLAWVTRSENQRHSVAHGTHAGGAHGERHPSAKLSYEIAASIRTEAELGASIRSLAAKYGVSHQPIHDIVKMKTWVPQADAQTHPDLSSRDTNNVG